MDCSGITPIREAKHNACSVEPDEPHKPSDGRLAVKMLIFKPAKYGYWRKNKDSSSAEWFETSDWLQRKIDQTEEIEECPHKVAPISLR